MDKSQMGYAYRIQVMIETSFSIAFVPRVTNALIVVILVIMCDSIHKAYNSFV